MASGHERGLALYAKEFAFACPPSIAAANAARDTKYTLQLGGTLKEFYFELRKYEKQKKEVFRAPD